MKNRYKVASFILAIFFLVFLPHSNLLNQFDMAFSQKTVLEKGAVESAAASNKATSGENESNPDPTAKGKLLADLEEQLSALKLYAVSVYDLNNGSSFGIHEDQAFPAASVMKILSATALLQAIDAGKYKLTQPLGGGTIDYQLEQMINQSNNDSWVLINTLVGIDNEQKVANNLGISGIVVNKNQMTSRAAEQLLLKLYKSEALTVSSRDKLFSYMQNTESENRISRGISENVTFYHKTGNFEGTIHDAAIVIHPKNPFILTMFTKDDTGQLTDDQRFDMFKIAAEKVYQYFDSF